MERLFIESPVDEEVDLMVAEAMEERFNTIVEYLQECVDEDQMTLEDANDIAEIAYEKYMTEGKASEFAKKHKKAIAIGAIAAGTVGASMYVDKKALKAYIDVMKKLCTETKERIKNAKKYIKSKNKIKAKAELTIAKANLIKAKATTKKQDDTIIGKAVSVLGWLKLNTRLVFGLSDIICDNSAADTMAGVANTGLAVAGRHIMTNASNKARSGDAIKMAIILEIERQEKTIEKIEKKL